MWLRKESWIKFLFLICKVNKFNQVARWGVGLSLHPTLKEWSREEGKVLIRRLPQESSISTCCSLIWTVSLRLPLSCTAKTLNKSTTNCQMPLYSFFIKWPQMAPKYKIHLHNTKVKRGDMKIINFIRLPWFHNPSTKFEMVSLVVLCKFTFTDNTFSLCEIKCLSIFLHQ